MPTTREVERKYEVPLGFVLPDLTDLAGVAAVDDPAELRLTALYYDTPGLRLARDQVALRRRVGGHDEGWHLKLPAGADRTEIQEPLGDQPDRVPEVLERRIRAISRHETLQPVARIRTRRLERPVLDANHDVLALVADDVVSSEAFVDQTVVQHWREVEVEYVSGPPSMMDFIDRRLRAAGARRARAASKLAHALAEDYPSSGDKPRRRVARRGGSRRGGPGRTRDRRRAERASQSLTGYLTAQRDAIVAAYPGVLADDVEAVHDMRVAIRRLRATMKTYRPLLRFADVPGLDERLRSFTSLLGAVRDGHVMGERLAREISAEPPELVVGPVAARIHERLASTAARDRTELHAALDSPQFDTILQQLDQLIDAPLRTVDSKRLRRLATRSVRRADRRLDLASQPLPYAAPLSRTSTPDARLHTARKAYKRARYAVELLRPFAGRPARRLTKELTALQDILGAHQDAVVTAALLRDFGMRAHLDGDNAFTYGLLHGRQQVERDQTRDLLAGARRRAGKRRIRDWLGAR